MNNQSQFGQICRSSQTVVLIAAFLLSGVTVAFAQDAKVPATKHPVMHFTPEEIAEMQKQHLRAPQYSVRRKEAVTPFATSLSLLPQLPYVPSERNQGDCGDCWQWACTGDIEIAHEVQNGVFDQLSVQFINSCNTNKSCCNGGNPQLFAQFYASEGFAIPRLNQDAGFSSTNGNCSLTPCSSIATDPRYPIASISPVTVTTWGVGQTQAVANIKSVLNQNQAVVFMFFLPTTAAWTAFEDWWAEAPENEVWSNYYCGQALDSGCGGHATLCVGYDDTDPSKAYWIILNSWGTTAGRTDGTFRVSQNLNYDGAIDNISNLWWETLNVQFGAATQTPNDLCGGAIALSENTAYTMNTGTATDDTTPCLGTCSKGVWFTYTPSCSGTATVTTCGSSFDTAIEIFGGTCGALNSIGCNVNGVCAPQSTFSFPCSAGTTYYICAGGHGNASGTLQIKASCVCTGVLVPTNTGCGGAIALSENTAYTLNTANATNNYTTPCLGTCYSTVWFTYTPSCSGIASVATCGSDFDTMIQIFGGTCAALTPIGCNDDGSCGFQALTSTFSFPCTAGTTYYILAGGYGGARGTLQITASADCGTPTNIECSGAIALSENTAYTIDTYNSPNNWTDQCLGETLWRGLWFTYTPSGTGVATVGTCGSEFDTMIDILTGTCEALTSVGCNDDSCGLQAQFSFPCTAGTTYTILAGGYNGASGRLQIKASLGQAPANNWCSGAITLSNPGSATMSTVDAISGAGPIPSCGDGVAAGGVWYKVTPTTTGPLTVTTDGSDYDTVLAVYSGSCGALTEVGCNDDDASDSLCSTVTFTGSAGTTYYLLVGGCFGASGNLQISVGSPPANGQCSGAIRLSNPGSATMNTDGATGDGGLYPDCSYGVNGAVWYTVTPTSTGPITVTTDGSDYDTVLAVYSGSCGTLTEVGCNDDDASGTLCSTVTFTGSAGTTYYLLVGGCFGASGNLLISASGGTTCAFSIDPTTAAFGAAGGSDGVSVTASNDCAWTATSNVGWITITSGGSGSGDGTVQFSVAANTSANALTGTMTIARQTFTVTQLAPTPCTYTLSATAALYSSSGGNGSVNVTAGSNCAWTAISNNGFITITSGGSGSGDGTVQFSVAANTSTNALTGTMTIAGQTFTVTQSASGNAAAVYQILSSAKLSVGGLGNDTSVILATNTLSDAGTFDLQDGQYDYTGTYALVKQGKQMVFALDANGLSTIESMLRNWIQSLAAEDGVSLDDLSLDVQRVTKCDAAVQDGVPNKATITVSGKVNAAVNGKFKTKSFTYKCVLSYWALISGANP